MSEIVKTGRSIIVAVMLGAFGATGGVVAASLAFPATAAAGELHPCQDQECEDCSWWQSCDRRCEEGVEDGGTYCDTSDPGEGDCDTRSCGHAD